MPLTIGVSSTFMRHLAHWRWDAATYDELSRIAEEHDRIGVYVERNQPHLLKAYEKDFLSNLINSTKMRCSQAMRP